MEKLPSPRTGGSRVWTDAGALALLALAVLLFFAPLAFTNLILGHGDAYLYFTPYWAYRDAALRAGHIPLWDPVLFMGAPFLANSQAGVLYPPNWLDLLLPNLLAPDAIKASIVAHVLLAGVLAYACARRAFGLFPASAWLAAALFALGGYLGMQVEHVNQVQGLAWMPLLFLLIGEEGAAAWALGAVVAMQLLAGHTQSAFVSLGGAGVYALWLSACRLWSAAHPGVPWAWPQRPASGRALLVSARAEFTRLALRLGPSTMRPLLVLATGVVVAVALAAAQLLPTLELSRESLRSGGLSEQEALSFSLAPPVIGRAFLPAYDTTVFNEYVAFLGAAALSLIALGAWNGHRDVRVIGIVLVAGAGLFCALGGYNPLYRLLVRHVPGFDLFRAPARWLALWSFAGALLAGLGLDALLRARATRRSAAGAALAGLVLVALLAALCTLGTTGARGEPVLLWPPVLPARSALAAWLGAALAAGALVLLAVYRPALRLPAAAALIAIALAELYFGARQFPYRHPTSPVVWSGVRPAMAQLLAAQDADGADPLAAARFLSLSAAEFDPGDAGEIWSAYGPSWPSDCGAEPPGRPDLVATVNPHPLLPPEEVCQLLIDTKQKEILGPDLPLGWDLPAVDGYDGGVLPLRNYSVFAQLLLAPGSETRDGRLRENVKAVPDGRLLSLMNVRWLITDKVGDVPYDGVFYDLRHGLTLGAAQGSSATLTDLPAFEATELRIVARRTVTPAISADAPVLRVLLTFSDGSSELLEARAGDVGTQADGVARLLWSVPRVLQSAVLSSRLAPGAGMLAVRGATLVDARTGAFQMLVVSGSGRYRLAHSADVKIYENLDVLPRAFVVSQALVADDAGALAAMRAPGWQPASSVLLAPAGERVPAAAAGPVTATLTLRSYSAERVIYDVDAGSDGWLVLSDAWYPGWSASVDGKAITLYRADVLFRAVRIPAGAHRVRFAFESPSWQTGVTVSLLAWLAFAAAAVALALVARRAQARH